MPTSPGAGCRPSGPTTWETSWIGTTSSSAFHGSPLLAQPIEERLPHRVRQAPSPAGDEPHGHLGAVGDGGGGATSGDRQRAVRATGRRLEQHQVDGGGRRPEPGGRHRLRLDLRPLQPSDEPGALVEHVDGQHDDVATADQRLGGEVGPAEHGDGRVLRERVDELVGGGVEVEEVGAPHGPLERVG